MYDIFAPLVIRLVMVLGVALLALAIWNGVKAVNVSGSGIPMERFEGMRQSPDDFEGYVVKPTE